MHSPCVPLMGSVQLVISKRATLLKAEELHGYSSGCITYNTAFGTENYTEIKPETREKLLHYLL